MRVVVIGSVFVPAFMTGEYFAEVKNGSNLHLVQTRVILNVVVLIHIVHPRIRVTT